MPKVKCGHCQKVHHPKTECAEIKALRTFVGDDEYQIKLKVKLDRKKRKARN